VSFPHSQESNNATNAPDVLVDEQHTDPHIDSSVVAEGPLHSGMRAFLMFFHFSMSINI
jgi:hypothetical protein